jgi:hypothetical protein
MPDTKGRTHAYFAEASIISGNLTLPLMREITPQAHAVLSPKGGYLAQHADSYKLEAVISYRSAHTQVAGNRDRKDGHGWSTLCTTSIEGLNVLDILTADRIVGQIITEHPLEGYVPHVSFLGTRIENLRIAGHPVQVDFDFNILGDKPANDAPYSLSDEVKARVAAQYKQITGQPNLPADLQEGYNQLSSTLGSREAVKCSLVNKASGAYPGQTFGHVIHIPNFGTVTLGKLNVTHDDFKKDDTGKETNIPQKTTVNLTMIDLDLGCAIAGHAGIGSGSTNGGSHP